MKVVLLAPLPPPSGGIASWTVRMLKAKLTGWDVEVVDEKLIGRSNHGDKNKKNIFVELYRCFRIWNNLKKSLKDKEAKVVHACTAATYTGMLRDYISSRVAHRKKRKFVIHFRCTVPNLMVSERKLQMCKKLCDHSDAVIVLNQASLDFLSTKTKTKCVLIPNFADKPPVDFEKEYSDKLETIVYTGGVTEEKGCAEIIEVAKKLPQYTFRLVGNARNEIQKLQKPENVILMGDRSKEEVYRELKAGDLYIFFSHMDSEGFSNSLVEAMSFGLPCIVSDWAANREMIENKGGAVLPIHDVEGLEKAILSFDTKNAREEAGKWCKNKVLSSYSEEVVTTEYVRLYESLLG